MRIFLLLVMSFFWVGCGANKVALPNSHANPNPIPGSGGDKPMPPPQVPTQYVLMSSGFVYGSATPASLPQLISCQMGTGLSHCQGWASSVVHNPIGVFVNPQGTLAYAINSDVSADGKTDTRTVYRCVGFQQGNFGVCDWKKVGGSLFYPIKLSFNAAGTKVTVFNAQSLLSHLGVMSQCDVDLSSGDFSNCAIDVNAVYAAQFFDFLNGVFILRDNHEDWNQIQLFLEPLDGQGHFQDPVSKPLTNPLITSPLDLLWNEDKRTLWIPNSLSPQESFLVGCKIIGGGTLSDCFKTTDPLISGLQWQQVAKDKADSVFFVLTQSQTLYQCTMKQEHLTACGKITLPPWLSRATLTSIWLP
jgi:hypothetical protein